jgi:FAD/FMN-containing dehydrogenase
MSSSVCPSHISSGGLADIKAENSGSISAEHGLGLMKAPYIRYSRDETAIGMMKQIKQMFDPKGLLNPGKYII